MAALSFDHLLSSHDARMLVLSALGSSGMMRVGAASVGFYVECAAERLDVVDFLILGVTNFGCMCGARSGFVDERYIM